MLKFLTPEGLIKIEQEIEDLKKKKPELAERIQAAKEKGDLSENAEYTTAKEELALVESRIRELKELIRTAEVVDHQKSDQVSIGSKVELKIGKETKIFTLVGKEEINPAQGFISYQSPLGEALLNKKINDKIIIKTPNGEISAEIINVE